MNDVVPKFPLLRLPRPAILNTLRAMDHIEIFGISVLSKKTKNLVESLKLKTRDFNVSVTYRLFVILQFHNHGRLFFEFYQVKENEPIRELETPENIHIRYGNTTVKWKNVMSVKQMLDLFQFIFHAPKTKLFFGINCERFSLESISKNVENFGRICFESGNHEHNKRVLSVFQPGTFDLMDEALINGQVPSYISIQNFDAISVFGRENIPFELNDLLITNARTIYFDCFHVPASILIQFLKLWMKGSNSRLEWVVLRFRRMDFQIDDVLSKLDHKVAPLNRLRLFQSSLEERQMRVIGGWDIWRYDGTQATIIYRSTNNTVYLSLFVWHDHCVLD